MHLRTNDNGIQVHVHLAYVDIASIVVSDYIAVSANDVVCDVDAVAVVDGAKWMNKYTKTTTITTTTTTPAVTAENKQKHAVKVSAAQKAHAELYWQTVQLRNET